MTIVVAVAAYLFMAVIVSLSVRELGCCCDAQVAAAILWPAAVVIMMACGLFFGLKWLVMARSRRIERMELARRLDDRPTTTKEW